MTQYDLRDQITEVRSTAKILFKDDSDTIKRYTDEDIRQAVAMNIKNIVELTNSSIIDGSVIASGIFEGIAQSHRHLQGEFMMVLEKAIRMYSETDRVDGRNQFAKEMCQRMIAGNDKE